MKSEKGITLISLIIYVIAMLITTTIITIITSYFYENIDVSSERYTYFSEFTKFESYFTEEMNESNNKVLEISNGVGNNQTYIIFATGNQYTYVPANKAIYQNSVKIANGVESCKFTESIKNGKSSVQVVLSIKGDDDLPAKERTINYFFNN